MGRDLRLLGACDQCCQNLFAHTAFALDKAVEWTRRPEEFVKRAAFVLAAADDERLYVRKGASWALRQVGKRSDRLQPRVLAAVDPYIHADGRGIRWVARDVSRELGSRPSRAGGYLRRRSSRP